MYKSTTEVAILVLFSVLLVWIHGIMNFLQNPGQTILVEKN
jgi:hypothetical protein